MKATCCCVTRTPVGSNSTTSATIRSRPPSSSVTSGLDWQFAGIGPIHAPGASDLVLRNVNTGAFEVYEIANNQIVGAAPLGSVGLEWQLGGFAADPPTSSMGSSGSTSQLVQAMAGFGSSKADTSNIVPLGADTSQQPLLTTPQHA